MPTRKRNPEDRRASLLAAINALPSSGHGGKALLGRTEVDFMVGAYSIIREAARLRRVSVPAFIRRAAYAMACYDLGMPLSDALERDPRMARENGFAIDDPEGLRFGVWEIAQLIGEE